MPASGQTQSLTTNEGAPGGAIYVGTSRSTHKNLEELGFKRDEGNEGAG